MGKAVSKSGAITVTTTGSGFLTGLKISNTQLIKSADKLALEIKSLYQQALQQDLEKIIKTTTSAVAKASSKEYLMQIQSKEFNSRTSSQLNSTEVAPESWLEDL